MKKTILIKPTKYGIGDNVTILWKRKDFYGKSVRRNVIDDIMESWRFNSLDNLKTELNFNCNYQFASTKQTLDTLQDIVSGKKACEGSVFKRHEESKRWFTTCIEAIDNQLGAVIIGIDAVFHFGSNIAPFNVCYFNNGVSFYRYKILIHGKAKDGNHVCFEVHLLDDAFKRKAK